MQMLLDIWDKI